MGLINSRKSDKTSVQPSFLHLSFIAEAFNTHYTVDQSDCFRACDLQSLIYKQVVRRGITVDGQNSQSQHVIDLFGAIKCSESQSKRTKGNYWIMVNSWSATKEIQSIYSSASRQASSFFLHRGLYNFLHPKISFLFLLWSSSPFQTKWCATTKSSTLRHYLKLGRFFLCPRVNNKKWHSKSYFFLLRLRTLVQFCILDSQMQLWKTILRQWFKIFFFFSHF